MDLFERRDAQPGSHPIKVRHAIIEVGDGDDEKYGDQRTAEHAEQDVQRGARGFTLRRRSGRLPKTDCALKGRLDGATPRNKGFGDGVRGASGSRGIVAEEADVDHEGVPQLSHVRPVAEIVEIGQPDFRHRGSEYDLRCRELYVAASQALTEDDLLQSHGWVGGGSDEQLCGGPVLRGESEADTERGKACKQG